MYAVIETGGKQYRVTEGDIIEVERLGKAKDSEVLFDRVLLIGAEDKTVLGTPTVAGARVKARVLAEGKARKIIVYKYRRRKKYRRKHGHRQYFTRLLIEEIRVE